MNGELEPWERRDGEPDNWYARFDRFRLLGPTRSIEEVYRQERAAEGGKGRQQIGKPTRHWYAAAETWEWLERAGAWDAERRAEEEEEERLAWRDKRKAWRHQQFELKERMLQKVTAMLNFPLTEVVREVKSDEGTIITQIIMPVRWNMSMAARMIREMNNMMVDCFPDDDGSDDLPPPDHTVIFERDNSYEPPEDREREHGREVIEEDGDEEEEDEE